VNRPGARGPGFASRFLADRVNAVLPLAGGLLLLGRLQAAAGWLAWVAWELAQFFWAFWDFSPTWAKRRPAAGLAALDTWLAGGR